MLVFNTAADLSVADEPAAIALIFLTVLLLLLVVLGNFVGWTVLRITTDLYHLLHYLLANLFLLNYIQGAICIISAFINATFLWRWTMGESMCAMWLGADHVIQTLSAWFIFAIIVDRWVYFRHRFRYLLNMHRSKWAVICCVWILCVVTCITMFILKGLESLHNSEDGNYRWCYLHQDSKTFAVYVSMFSFFLPCGSAVVLYIILFVLVRKQFFFEVGPVGRKGDKCRLSVLSRHDTNPLVKEKWSKAISRILEENVELQRSQSCVPAENNQRFGSPGPGWCSTKPRGLSLSPRGQNKPPLRRLLTPLTLHANEELIKHLPPAQHPKFILPKLDHKQVKNAQPSMAMYPDLPISSRQRFSLGSLSNQSEVSSMSLNVAELDGTWEDDRALSPIPPDSREYQEQNLEQELYISPVADRTTCISRMGRAPQNTPAFQNDDMIDGDSDRNDIACIPRIHSRLSRVAVNSPNLEDRTITVGNSRPQSRIDRIIQSTPIIDRRTNITKMNENGNSSPRTHKYGNHTENGMNIATMPDVEQHEYTKSAQRYQTEPDILVVGERRPESPDDQIRFEGEQLVMRRSSIQDFLINTEKLDDSFCDANDSATLPNTIDLTPRNVNFITDSDKNERIFDMEESEDDENYTIELNHKNYHSLKKLGSLVFIYVICWLPFHAVYLSLALFESYDVNYMFYGYLQWFGYLNAALNPLVYFLMSNEFREAAGKVIHCVNPNPEEIEEVEEESEV